MMALFDRFFVGYHFVGALINGDHSGLSDRDEQDLERFMEELIDQTGKAWMVWTVEDDQTEFARCDVSRKWDACVTLELHC